MSFKIIYESLYNKIKSKKLFISRSFPEILSSLSYQIKINYSYLDKSLLDTEGGMLRWVLNVVSLMNDFNNNITFTCVG
jgi:hypothetical protein